jgi:transcriptional regulator with XRE-family HTH domain
MRRMMIAMSQEKLGAALGVTFQQVQKYEKGMNRIGASRLQQISHILQVPVPFFFEGAPNLHGSTDGMKKAHSPSYLRVGFPRHSPRAFAEQGFHADQRTQAQAPHR